MDRYGLSDEAIAKVAAAKAGKKDSSGQIVGKIRQTVSSGIQSASTGVKNATETGRVGNTGYTSFLVYSIERFLR